MTDDTAAGGASAREDSAATMHIGELAERTGLSLRSLRHWDEVGLVQASGRTEGGFRLYTAADERRIRLTMSMKPFGFTLEELAELTADRAAFFATVMCARPDKLVSQMQDANTLQYRVSPVQADPRVTRSMRPHSASREHPVRKFS